MMSCHECLSHVYLGSPVFTSLFMTAFDLYLCLHYDKIPLIYFKGKKIKLQITNGKRHICQSL